MGPKGVQNGVVELTNRSDGTTIEVGIDEVVGQVTGHIEAARVPVGAEPIYR